MADVEFFFDPVCPWAWITSRWVSEVQRLRSYVVEWRFISLRMINESLVAEWYTPEYKHRHMAGLHGLRVADRVRLEQGNDGVARFYGALGTAIHQGGSATEFADDPVPFARAVLLAAEQPPEWAEDALDDHHDLHIRADTELALARAGRDVGTPILTFHPGQVDESSFFGPVISSIPRGDKAVQLWDAVELLATTSGMAELKRANRDPISFD